MPCRFICATILFQSPSSLDAGLATAGCDADAVGAAATVTLAGDAIDATDAELARAVPALGVALIVRAGAADTGPAACEASATPNASILNNTISNPPRVSGASSRSRRPTMAI